MSVVTSHGEHCPKCNVFRAVISLGQWCSTCGYNPNHEAELAALRAALDRAEELIRRLELANSVVPTYRSMQL